MVDGHRSPGHRGACPDPCQVCALRPTVAAWRSFDHSCDRQRRARRRGSPIGCAIAVEVAVLLRAASAACTLAKI